MKKNKFLAAFQETFNLVGLAGIGAIGIAGGAATIPFLLAGVALEAAYLLFVPDSRWYVGRLSARFDSEVAERRAQLAAQILPTVGQRTQERFHRLEAIRAQIKAQPGMEKEDWFREVLRKLDYLLEKFLLFASKESQFRSYIQSVYDEGATGPVRASDRDEARGGNRRGRGPVVPGGFDLSDDDRSGRGGRDGSRRPTGRGGGPPDGPPELTERWTRETVHAIQDRYDAEIVRVDATRQAEEDMNTQAILDKRIEVLQQRREYVGKIGKILTNLGHQMELLEDSFGLINDQIRARSPEQVLADIEGVVFQTDSMTKLLDELAPFEHMADRLAA